MNALYLTNKPIYPTVDGGCVAMASFLNHLLNIHEKVDHLTVSTYKHPFDSSKYNIKLQDNFRLHAIFINTKISILKAFLNLFSKSSYHVIRFFSRNFENKLIELLKNKYDIIYIESIFLLPYLKTIRKHSNAKVILRTPNIEYKIWEKQLVNCKNPFEKLYLKHLTKNLKRFEIKQYSLVDGILSISNHDESFIKSITTSTPILNLPFAIKTNEVESIKMNHFFFIGAYNWRPNLDAVLYLLNELFPTILNKYPDAKLHIAGSFTPDFLYEFNSKNVTIHGKVESVKQFMSNHGILLAPIFSGSGVRIKILEALSIGIPVIGTSLALQGIHCKACFTAENKIDFIDKIDFINNTVISDIQKEAIEYININYHPTEIEKQLNDFISSC
jgi:glycosyltransferase involved in cell wall biosynthesis